MKKIDIQNSATVLIFEPTLSPNPFGEGSPELCWELPSQPFTLSLRLNQFGWTGALKEAGPQGQSLAFQADSLLELSDQFRFADQLQEAHLQLLQLKWVLAYDIADSLDEMTAP